MRCSVFISDLHLSPDQEAITDLFKQCLAHIPKECDALYILGDLFNAWIGHDINRRFQAEIIDTLNTLKNRINIYFMPGNRDFLLDTKRASPYPFTVLSDPCTINLYGRPTWLTHGDRYCLKDKNHQSFRAISQHPISKRIFLLMPKTLRLAIAKKLMRTDTVMHNTGSLPQQYDVVQSKLFADMQSAGCSQVIHGHTHQPSLQIKLQTSEPIRRMVLSDWHENRAHTLVYFADHRVESRFFANF